MTMTSGKKVGGPQTKTKFQKKFEFGQGLWGGRLNATMS